MSSDLEGDIIDYILVAAVFLVAAYNLSNYTAHGKIFSIITLGIATLLLMTIAFEYFSRKDEIETIRKSINILVYAVIAFAILNIIIIYQMLRNESII